MVKSKTLQSVTVILKSIMQLCVFQKVAGVTLGDYSISRMRE